MLGALSRPPVRLLKNHRKVLLEQFRKIVRPGFREMSAIVADELIGRREYGDFFVFINHPPDKINVFSTPLMPQHFIVSEDALLHERSLFEIAVFPVIVKDSIAVAKALRADGP